MKIRFNHKLLEKINSGNRFAFDDLILSNKIYDYRYYGLDFSEVVFMLSRRGNVYGPFNNINDTTLFGHQKALDDINKDYRDENGVVLIHTVMDFFIFSLRGKN